MMIDFNAQFCNASTIPTAQGSAICGDVYDTGAAPTLKDIGTGARQLFLVIAVNTAVTSAGAATVDFRLLSDSAANLATSATTHISSGAIPKASLGAGAKIVLPLPPGNYERYVGLFAAVAGADLTAGKVDAFLTFDPPTNGIYPDAI